MSATSTSTDPVQSVVDILDGYSSAQWPNDKPTYIEKQWESSFRDKSKRNDPAAYVYSPDRADTRAFGRDANTRIQGEVIAVDVWALDSDEAATVAGDVQSILEDYWEDGKANTTWNRIRPEDPDDRRAEALARRADHFIISVRVQLEAERSMGT